MKKLFQSSSVKISYVVTCTHPDLSFNNTQQPHVLKDIITESHIKLLNSTVRMLQTDTYKNIHKLDIESIYIYGYVDAGFDNKEDLSSQLDLVVI